MTEEKKVFGGESGRQKTKYDETYKEWLEEVERRPLEKSKEAGKRNYEEAEKKANKAEKLERRLRRRATLRRSRKRKRKRRRLRMRRRRRRWRPKRLS